MVERPALYRVVMIMFTYIILANRLAPSQRCCVNGRTTYRDRRSLRNLDVDCRVRERGGVTEYIYR